MTDHILPGVAFPGQGNKPDATVAALREHRGHFLVAEFLLRNGTVDPSTVDLGDTSVSQPATYAAGIASAEWMLGKAAPVPLVLGHSLGELTAAAYAGMIDPADGFHLAVRRGEICKAQQGIRAGAMLAVMGTDITGVEWLRRQAIWRSGAILEVAGLNGRRQTVLSGDVAAIEAGIAIAAEMGVLAEIIPVGGSFHSPLMLDAVAEWRETVDSVEFTTGHTPLISTVDGRVHTDPAEVKELLVRALLLPVRWLDALRAARDFGVTTLWDAGPGRTLEKLGRREGVVEFARLTQPLAALEAAE
ncbi:[acyl-carrier-protein] S-malonyltransferase [Amycolatopsis xylanica]|uniref:[acyl-carrier-protein] S-malonyltransferase n=1 Tax=Amycolatopsis xylanica TaxID=589385 RepID=A0A1H3PG25_9PSEU|nr:ACP S-malonyltransferase [Amycolatopsis xylanica]SDZ00084.1 [acyl-carrier-protein] S-malonyltransferase [Amycolatopsis xylanica]